MSEQPTTGQEFVPFPEEIPLNPLSTYRPAVGDYVRLADDFLKAGEKPRPYKVRRVPATEREHNVSADALDGSRGMKAPAWAWQKLEADDPLVLAAAEAPKVLTTGEAFRFKGPRAPAGIFVVIGPGSKGGMKAAKLGGDGGRYYPDVAASHVERVALDLGAIEATL